MPPWIANNVTEVTVEGQWTNGRPIATVLHVRRDNDDPQQSARDVLDNWQDHILPRTVNNYVLKGARFVDKNTADGVTGFVLPNTAKLLQGGTALPSGSPNVACLVRKFVNAQVGRRAGRMYLPPQPDEVISEDGIITAATLAALQTDLANFFAGVSGALDNELVVVHKKIGEGFSPVSIVTGLAMDSMVATMRRRLRR